VSAGKWALREELISCRTAGSVRDMIASFTHINANTPAMMSAGVELISSLL